MMPACSMHEAVGNAGMSGGCGEGEGGAVCVCVRRLAWAGEAGACPMTGISKSRVTQRHRVGPITQRSVVQIQALLPTLCDAACTEIHASCDGNTRSPPSPSPQHTPPSYH